MRRGRKLFPCANKSLHGYADDGNLRALTYAGGIFRTLCCLTVIAAMSHRTLPQVPKSVSESLCARSYIWCSLIAPIRRPGIVNKTMHSISFFFSRR